MHLNSFFQVTLPVVFGLIASGHSSQKREDNEGVEASDYQKVCYEIAGDISSASEVFYHGTLFGQVTFRADFDCVQVTRGM